MYRTWKKFDAIFDEVMNELGLTDWRELYNSDNFSIVEKRASEWLGYEASHSAEYCEWEDEKYRESPLDTGFDS